MSDTFSTTLKFRKMETGQYLNTWGGVLNSDDIQLIDDAIAGQGALNVGTSIAFSVPALANGTSSASRMCSMIFTGSPAATVVVTMPTSVTTKLYLIDNQTGQILDIGYIGGSSRVEVADGEKRLIWCDNPDAFDVLAKATDAASLGGVPAADWARTIRTATETTADTRIANKYKVGVINAPAYFTVTEGPTTTIDASEANNQSLTLTGNRAMAAPTNPTDGEPLTLLVIQDATGGRLLTWDPIFLFPGGQPPLLATTPGSMDRFDMSYNAALNKWVVGVFSAIGAASGSQFNIVISQNQIEFNLAQYLGSVGSAATVTITINKGVVVKSLNTALAALDLFNALPAGSSVNLINNGIILGRGGAGAAGAIASFPGSGGVILSAPLAGDGGKAISGPGAGIAFSITNASGFIWGGGGGGGGGGAYDGVLTGNGLGNAGGGGGGAGGGQGGQGGLGVYISGGSTIGINGTNGTYVASGANGVGGSGSHAGTGQVGAAGDGGDWGAVGTDGLAPSVTDTGHTGAFSVGGAAGKAIELNAGPSPTFISGGSSPNVKGAVS